MNDRPKTLRERTTLLENSLRIAIYSLIESYKDDTGLQIKKIDIEFTKIDLIDHPSYRLTGCQLEVAV